MKNWLLIPFFLFILAISALAQEPDLSKVPGAKEKTAAWIAYCESLRLNVNNTKNNYTVLENAALRGVAMTSVADAMDRSRFFFYAAFGSYYQVKFDSAQYYFYKSLTAAQQAGSAELIASACVALIPVNFQLREQNKVDSCKNLLQSITDTTKNKKILQDGYSALGSYYQQKSFYSTAQDYFLRSITLRKEAIDTTTDMKLRADYAIQCYMLSKQYQNTDILDKSLAILREGNRFAAASPLVVVRYLSSFTEIFALMGSIDSALYYEKLLDKETAGSPTVPSELVSANMNIAKYYLDHHQASQALPFVIATDTLASKSKSPILLYQAEMIKGRHLGQTGKYKEAILLFRQSLPVARQISKEQYAEELKYMAIAEKEDGNLEDAWQLNEQYILATDSLIKEKISNNFADQETHYQTNQKELRIVALGRENQLQILELQTASRTRLFLVLGLIALGIISLLLYFIYRNKENVNQLLNKKNEQLGELNEQLALANETKAKLFGIIGHDLRSPVGKIVQLLRLQKENPELITEDSKQRHEQHLKIASENVLETMEDLLLWSKSQMQHFTPQLKNINIAAVIRKEAGMFIQQAEEKNVQFINEMPDQAEKFTDENILSVIIRNLLQNAVKYSDRNGSITIVSDSDNILITNTSSKADITSLNKLLQNKELNSSSSGLGLQIASELALLVHVRISFIQRKERHLTAVIAWQN